MGGQYGPNTRQVQRFIDRLRALTAEDWQQVAAAEPLARAAYGSADWLQIQAMAYSHYGYDRANKFAEGAGKSADAIFRMSPPYGPLAHGAVAALVNCELMTAEWFAAEYAPFLEVIPIETLGPGKAPVVAKSPGTIWGRFVTRLKALDPPERQQAARVAYAIQEAVGVDALEAAAHAAVSSLRLQDADSVDPLISAIDSAEEDEAQEVGRQAQFLAEALNMDETRKASWTRAYVAPRETELSALALAAKRAAVALMARDLITGAQFALLYAPFAGLIPESSLEVPQATSA